MVYVVYMFGIIGYFKGVLYLNLSVISYIDFYWKVIGLSDEYYNMLFLVNYVFLVVII